MMTRKDRKKVGLTYEEAMERVRNYHRIGGKLTRWDTSAMLALLFDRDKARVLDDLLAETGEVGEIFKTCAIKIYHRI